MHSSVRRTMYTKYGITCLPSQSSEDRGMRKRALGQSGTLENLSQKSVLLESKALPTVCIGKTIAVSFYHIFHDCAGSVLGFCLHRFIRIVCNMTLWLRTHCPLLLFLPVMKIPRLQYQRQLVNAGLFPNIYKGKILRFSLWSTMLAVTFHSNYQTRLILFCSQWIKETFILNECWVLSSAFQNLSQHASFRVVNKLTVIDYNAKLTLYLRVKKTHLALLYHLDIFLIQFVSNLLWVLNKVNGKFWSSVFSCYNIFILSRCKNKLPSSFIFFKKKVQKLYCFSFRAWENSPQKPSGLEDFFIFGKILNFESKLLFLLGSVLVTCIFKELNLTCFNLGKYCHTRLYNILVLTIF